MRLASPSAPPAPSGRHRAGRSPVPRPRPFAAPRHGPVPTDYSAFCDVSVTHAGGWSLTYSEGAETPYTATSLADSGLWLASSDLGLLDAALCSVAGPPRVRPYLVRAEAEHARRRRAERVTLERLAAGLAAL
jgi:hypothetical protein